MRFLRVIHWLQATGVGRVVAAQGGRLAASWRAVRRTRRPSVATLRKELQQSATELQAVCGELEKYFLATGGALEKLAVQGEQFVQASDELVGAATGRAGSSTLLFQAMRVMEEPLDFLKDSRPKTQVILQRLRQDSQRIDELINVQVELRQTVGPLKYIQTLFKIESAPLGGDVQAMFGALTKEIETLHDQICELFTTRFLELRGVQRAVNQVIRELQTQTDGQWESISREKAKIEQSLQEMQAELMENQTRESHIGVLGRQVSAEIQQVVTGVQYQDIINQKLQHVLASLRRMDERLVSDAAMAEVGPAGRLEAGQLQAVRRELAGAEKLIRDGIGQLQERLTGASAGCLTLEEYGQLTISADGMVQVLFDTFATLREQVAATVTSSARAFDQLRSVGGLASDLTQVVREHSQRIHLIGLNAQLQAAQVGNQAGLEVLSARTSEISRATNQLSEAVARKLDQLVKDLAEDVKALETLNAEALRQQGQLAAEGATTEQTLHVMRDGALALLTQINTLLENIRTDAQAAQDAIGNLETMDTALGGLESQLLAVARAADECLADAGNPGNPGNLLVEQAAQGYTMTSQHKVFAKVVAGQEQPAESEEGFVELFETPAVVDPPTLEAPAATVVPPAGSAMLPPEAGVAPPPEPGPKGHEAAANGSTAPVHLGDNVELFE